MTTQFFRTLVANVLFSAPLFVVGCGGSDDTSDPAPDPTPSDGTRFVLASTVSGMNDSTTYVSYMTSIDVEEVKIEDAYEFPGWASIATEGGHLFVSDGDAPTITRFTRDESGHLAPDGKLSFLDYGLSSAPFYSNYFASGTKSYMAINPTERVIWDPTALAIRGELNMTEVAAERDGFTLRSSLDRGVRVRKGQLFMPFYWSDADYYRHLPTSQIAVFDTENDKVSALLDAPCPGLDVATQDDDGNFYFSNWVFTTAAPHFEESAPSNCVVRIAAGSSTIDESFNRDLSELTEGRQIAAFRYLSKGVALMAVFYHERLTADVLPARASGTNNWRLWRVDTNQWTAEPIEGLDFFGGGYYSFRMDGRTLVLLPAGDYGSTTAYEIGAEGPAQKRFSVPGWAFQMIQLD